jgi:cation:H+ antiporter
MELFIAFWSIIFWLILLTFWGNALVDGAVTLAKRMKISEAIIWLTIVAIGTSMPELIVSLLAAIRGSSEIAIGNVLGSNIANIFLILWITAIISRMTLSKSTRFFDLPVVILVTLLLLLLVSDRFFDGSINDAISRIDSVILLIFACLYILYSVKHNNITPDGTEEVEIISSNWKLVVALAGWVWALFFGGKILVDGAVSLASMAGLSEAIIGLTIVAIGTSTPELVTSIIAARKWKADLAIWNIVGSNIMNILIILGISGAITPMVFNSGSFIDLIVGLMGPIVLLLLSIVWTKNELGRKEGILLFLIYTVYLGYLIAREMS